MQAELDAIKKNKYKVKKDNMGNVVKYKANLISKGYVQKQRVDYDEVFAHVAILDTIRVILALADQHRWSVHHLDVKSAFLNGDLENSQDPTVYTRNSKGKSLIVKVYVDDLIITGSHIQDIIEFKEQMKNEFKMNDLGLFSYYLGIEVSQKSPMEPKLKVDNVKGGEEIDSTEYRQLLGCLRFTDSDHGGDLVGGKSTGAEFMAATSAACQAIWLANLVKELTGQDVEPITLFVDNKSAIALMKNPVFHGRSKHINIRFHFIRECVEQGKIIVEHVNTKDQRADLFTKALALVKFIEMRNKLGLTDTEPGPV
ncbi:ribonuclease H-like domain, reverse transcriptase, RNA-dependent DNA polymerase [Tanacetum coccineum]